MMVVVIALHKSSESRQSYRGYCCCGCDGGLCGGGYICNDFSVGGLFLRMQWKSSWWESVDTVHDEV